MQVAIALLIRKEDSIAVRLPAELYDVISGIFNISHALDNTPPIA
jgi:hypothetical protein